MATYPKYDIQESSELLNPRLSDPLLKQQAGLEHCPAVAASEGCHAVGRRLSVAIANPVCIMAFQLLFKAMCDLHYRQILFFTNVFQHALQVACDK